MTAHHFGLGLRKPHHDAFLAGAVPVDFVEVISENFIGVGGRPRAMLHGVRAHHPVALHGVSLSPGTPGGPDPDYLAGLRALVDEIEPCLVSDHLCWTRAHGWQSHDLLPLPYTDEALTVVCTAVSRMQDALARPICIENPSSYLAFEASTMDEATFLTEVIRRTGCGLLLDVNNIHVSARNHGFDPRAYLAALPLASVRQIHLAGHDDSGPILVDTHDRAVPPPVWTLYAETIARCPPATHVMIERDDAIPPLADLLTELETARALACESIPA